MIVNSPAIDQIFERDICYVCNGPTQNWQKHTLEVEYTTTKTKYVLVFQCQGCKSKYLVQFDEKIERPF